MKTSTEHILQCNQSNPRTDASGRIVDLMNENELDHAYRTNVMTYTKITHDKFRRNNIQMAEWRSFLIVFFSLSRESCIIARAVIYNKPWEFADHLYQT